MLKFQGANYAVRRDRELSKKKYATLCENRAVIFWFTVWTSTNSSASTKKDINFYHLIPNRAQNETRNSNDMELIISFANMFRLVAMKTNNWIIWLKSQTNKQTTRHAQNYWDWQQKSNRSQPDRGLNNNSSVCIFLRIILDLVRHEFDLENHWNSWESKYFGPKTQRFQKKKSQWKLFRKQTTPSLQIIKTFKIF